MYHGFGCSNYSKCHTEFLVCNFTFRENRIKWKPASKQKLSSPLFHRYKQLYDWRARRILKSLFSNHVVPLTTSDTFRSISKEITFQHKSLFFPLHFYRVLFLKESFYFLIFHEVQNGTEARYDESVKVCYEHSQHHSNQNDVCNKIRQKMNKTMETLDMSFSSSKRENSETVSFQLFTFVEATTISSPTKQ